LLSDLPITDGDLKPKNLIRVGTSGIRIIDLDASAKIGTQLKLAKYSSAFIPPEMIHIDATTGEPIIKQQPEPGTTAAYELVTASAAYDSWSLGVVLYHLCSGKPLLFCDDEDNIETVDLLALAACTSEWRREKVEKIPNREAQNLVSQLLSRDPSKRPSMDRALQHPFITLHSNVRLAGEAPQFDVFLSYRVASDSEHVKMLYEELTEMGVKVWW
jgi:serine/threonine protein kinase